VDNGKSRQSPLIESKSQSKRDVNPLRQINLKISNKMIEKGLGPQLPSSVYADELEWPIKHHANYKDVKGQVDQQTEFDDTRYSKIPNYNLFKRDLAGFSENGLKIDENGRILNNQSGRVIGNDELDSGVDTVDRVR
jgi:hypothetical protein